MTSLRSCLLVTTVLAGFAFTAGTAAAASPAATADGAAAMQVTNVNAGTQAAQSFVAKMGDRALGVIRNEGMSDAERASGLRNVLTQSFDLQTIARFSLGRYWREATPAQQSQYVKLFEDMVVNVYTNRFRDYAGQTFTVESANADANGGDAIVHSIVTPAAGKGGAPINVDWRVRNKGGSYKVVDVMVEGVSMAVTQRSDFSAVIQKNGGDFQALLDYLKTPQATANAAK